MFGSLYIGRKAEVIGVDADIQGRTWRVQRGMG